MKIVFICGPYRGTSIFSRIRNVLKARRVAIRFWKKGYSVICPHSNSAFFDKHCHDEFFLEGYLAMVKCSDILVMLPGWKNSSGSREEYKLALKLQKRVIFV